MNSLSLMEWKTEYNIGIEKIDNQHQKLVSIINNLINSHRENRPRGEIENIFLGLVNYCNYHFTIEEQAMSDNKYYEYEPHKAKHDEFFYTIDDLKLKYNKGDSSALIETVNYLSDWLIKHILVEDRKYVPHLGEKMK